MPQSQPAELFSYKSALLRGIFFVNARQGCAVGEQGNILLSSDGGESWIPAESGATVEFSDVFFLNERLGWAASYRGRGGMYATRDGGKTWRLQSANVFAQSVSFSDSLRGAASGGSGVVYRTLDGGETWTQLRLPTPNAVFNVRFLSAPFDVSFGAAAARDGVFLTRDGGATWRKTNLPTGDAPSPAIRDVFFVDSLRGWACGANNALFATRDGGETWTAQQAPALRSNAEFSALQFFSPQLGYMSDDNFRLYKTLNGGETWTPAIQFPANGFLQDFHFATENDGWAITTRTFSASDISGDHVIVWRTRDGGATWTQAATNRVTRLTSARLLETGDDRLSALAVGAYSLNRTDNGGARWTIHRPETDTVWREGQFYQTIAALGGGKAVAVGWYSRVARTDDGGRRWIPLSLTETTRNDSLIGVYFVDSLYGWTVGIRHGYNRAPAINRIYHTRDGGATWQRQTPAAGFAGAPNAALHSVFFLNRSLGWAVGEEGLILATQDGGATWRRQTSPTRLALHKVVFRSASLGYACGGGGESSVILITTNGGETWRRQFIPAESALHGIAFADDARGWAVGKNGLILSTLNGGELWEQQESGVSEDLFDIVFADRARGLVVGDYGVILSTSNGGFTPRLRAPLETELRFEQTAVGAQSARMLEIKAEHLLEPLVVSAPAGFFLEYAGAVAQTIALAPTRFAETSATVGIVFAPQFDGALADSLRIASARLSAAVPLFGFGVRRPILQFSAQNDRLEFLPTNVGEERVQELIIRNIGVAAGTLSLSLAPDSSGREIFAAHFPSGAIAAGDSARVELRFRPTSFGRAESVLTARVQSEQFDTAYVLRLTGVGLQGKIEPQPRALDFGAAGVGERRTAFLGLKNIGNAPARVAMLEIAGDESFSLSGANAAPFIVQPDSTALVGVGFAPARLGFLGARLTARLAVAGDKSDSVVAQISGVGAPPLERVQLRAPYNGRINAPASLQFLWIATPNAVAYDIEISERDSLFAAPLIRRGIIGSLAFAPVEEFRPSTLYYWRVRARNDAAIGEWSEIFSFETIRPSPLLRAGQELVEISAIAGYSQRGYLSLRSSVADTILRADFSSLNERGAFSLRQDQFPLPLRANVTESLTFNFAPDRPFTTPLRGILRVVAQRDTLLVPFFGESLAPEPGLIVTRLGIQSDKVNVAPGDTVLLRLVLLESENLPSAAQSGSARGGRAESFNALIRIRNESVLSPLGSLRFPANVSENLLLGAGGKTIELRNIPRPSDLTQGVLAEIPAVALLGNAPSTVVEYLSFAWNDDAGARFVQSVIDSSLATIVCTAGGAPRLLQRRQSANIVAVSPNPAHEIAEVEYLLLESGYTTLYLADVLGRRVKTLFDGHAEAGAYAQSFSLADAPTGIYTLVLQTPNAVFHRRITRIR